jgi:hypothetical protein
MSSMTRAAWIGCAQALALASACGGAGGEYTADTEKPPLGPMSQEPALGRGQGPRERTPAPDNDSCPMHLAGVQVASEVTPEGAALVFTTRTGDVTELRSRVRALASHENTMSAAAGAIAQAPGGADTGRTRLGHDGASSDAAHAVDSHAPQAELTLAATVSVEEIGGGARLVFAAKSGAQLGELREHVRMLAQDMKTGDCPTTGAMPGERIARPRQSSPAAPAAPAPPEPSGTADQPSSSGPSASREPMPSPRTVPRPPPIGR